MLDSQYRQLNADEQLGFRQQINTGGWVRVSRRFVCPVCEGPDNCQVSADGAVVWCGRRSDLPSFTGKINAGGQFLHRMDRLAGGVWPLPRPTPRKQQREKLPPATVAELLTMYHRGATPTNLAELEQELGVPVPTVARAGWNAGAGGWTRPGWAAAGPVVGRARLTHSWTSWVVSPMVCLRPWADRSQPDTAAKRSSDNYYIIYIMQHRRNYSIWQMRF